MAQLHTINPLSDPRWGELVSSHPQASIFHQTGWLEALSRTYGYEPLAITSTPLGEPLRDGLVLCRVSSWITGSRLVSLPFTDHCALLPGALDVVHFLSWLRAEYADQNLKYVEIRPLDAFCPSAHEFGFSTSYWLHLLDLSPSFEKLFAALHKDCFQRKIRRAEREKVICEVGNSGRHLDEFFRLLVMTRQRQGLPPQPKNWFKNLLKSLGPKMRIRIARQNGAAVGAMITLEHQSTVVYKYGCSDQRFHHLGIMPFLFWNVIEDAKASGAEAIDLGRSDLDNQGLIAFKDRLGAARQALRYYRYPRVDNLERKQSVRSLRRLASRAPEAALTALGRIVYRHVG